MERTLIQESQPASAQKAQYSYSMQTQHESRPTVWVFGDQLNRRIGALSSATPETHRILIVESGVDSRTSYAVKVLMLTTVVPHPCVQV